MKRTRKFYYFAFSVKDQYRVYKMYICKFKNFNRGIMWKAPICYFQFFLPISLSTLDKCLQVFHVLNCFGTSKFLDNYIPPPRKKKDGEDVYSAKPPLQRRHFSLKERRCILPTTPADVFFISTRLSSLPLWAPKQQRQQQKKKQPRRRRQSQPPF